MAGGAGDGGARKQDWPLNSRGNAGGARGEGATDWGRGGEAGRAAKSKSQEEGNGRGAGVARAPRGEGQGREGARSRPGGAAAGVGAGHPRAGTGSRSCTPAAGGETGGAEGGAQRDLGRAGAWGAREAATDAPESPGRGWEVGGGALTRRADRSMSSRLRAGGAGSPMASARGQAGSPLPVRAAHAPARLLHGRRRRCCPIGGSRGGLHRASPQRTAEGDGGGGPAADGLTD